MQNGKTGTDIGKTGTDIGKTGIYFTALLCTPRKMGKREFNYRTWTSGGKRDRDGKSFLLCDGAFLKSSCD